MPDTSDTKEPADARETLLWTCEEMEKRLHNLVDSHRKVSEEIHQLRKLGKRLRGALTVAGVSKSRRRNIAVIGRVFGGSRDATVRAKTWRSLGIPSGTRVEAALRSLLDLEAEVSHRRPPREVVEWALDALKEVKDHIESLTSATLTKRAAQRSAELQRNFERRLKKALSEPTNTRLHDCRKAAKAWLGAQALLPPSASIPQKKQINELCEHLGDENDLEVLAAWLKDRGFSSKMAKEPWKALCKRQDKVRRAALARMRKLESAA